VNILGISAYYHDSAAALVCDGVVVAAAQEERFSREKHDASLPLRSMEFCLRRGGVAADGLDAVVFYDKPIDTFVRLLRTSLQVAPRGFAQFRRAMPVWMREKLWIPFEIERGLTSIGYHPPRRVHFCEHHVSHAASAFYPSPFPSAAVLTFDGVGEWTTASIGVGRGSSLRLERQLRFPHSLGLLYSAFTAQCGFKVNSGEYKLMGLAPYGEPTYAQRIMDHLVQLRDDGSFSLDTRYFAYLRGERMTTRRFEELFDGPAREPESPITRREVDLARSIQQVTEDIVLHMSRYAAEITGERRACLAGGVALNCVSNARLRDEGPFDDIWVQPASGDAGGAIGAALHLWHGVEGHGREVDDGVDGMSGCYLGPGFGDDEIRAFLDAQDADYQVLEDDAARARRVAELLARGHVVALFMGRMEFGPRALGHRSILADPRSPAMQQRLNASTKRRESFRPFAPAVLRERADEWFELDVDSPYMTFVAPVRGVAPVPVPIDAIADGGAPPPIGRLPAITHVDGTARVQTVDRRTSPRFHAILSAFEDLTGCPVLLNTSFNVRGEPIVCTPEDAYRCFRGTGVDDLVLEHFLLESTDQQDRGHPPRCVDS
jgi:carbamoyltransferase